MSKVLVFQKHHLDNISIRHIDPKYRPVLDESPQFTVKYYVVEDGVEVQYSAVATVVDTDDIPQDKIFREAWEISGNSVSENLEKARTIAHEKRRAHREKFLEPHDKLATSPIASVKANANAAKQAILDADTPVQTAIDAAGDVDTFKQILVNYGAV